MKIALSSDMEWIAFIGGCISCNNCILPSLIIGSLYEFLFMFFVNVLLKIEANEVEFLSIFISCHWIKIYILGLIY